MNKQLTRRSAWRWLASLVVLAFVFGSGVNTAVAQAEPTLNQVYEAARSGRLDQAQSMMKQVLAAHPNSARAHFVEAELLAQQGRLDAARASLANAERLAPGLPFASASAVEGLRSRLSGGGLNGLSGVGPRTYGSAPASGRDGRDTPRSSPASPSSAPASGSLFGGWLMPILLVGGGIAVFLMMRRRRSAAAASQAAAYPGAYNAPQGYGQPAAYAGGPQPYGPGQPGQPYAQPYPQQQPAGGGWGSRIAGGLATGAAIGAGMMAAEAIARNMGHGSSRGAASDAFSSGDGRDVSIPAGDLGGENFGVSGSGWDDSSSISNGDMGGGGGGDWDT